MKKRVFQIVFLILTSVSIFLFFFLKLNRFFTYKQVASVKYFILNFGLFGPLIIIAFYIGFNIVILPTLFFTFLSGYLYGIEYGFLIAWIGMILGFTISFLNSRYLFHKDFNARFGEKKMTIELQNYSKKYGIFLVIFLRIFFIIPYNLQNVLYGLTVIKPWKYILGSALGVLPTTIAYVILGKLISDQTMGKAQLSQIMLGITLFIVFFASIMFTTILIRKKLKLKAEIATDN